MKHTPTRVDRRDQHGHRLYFINGRRNEKQKNGLLMARKTGEYRPPKKGEYYLSGSIVEAYQAHSDLSAPYYIAEPVEVEVVTTYRVIPAK